VLHKQYILYISPKEEFLSAKITINHARPFIEKRIKIRTRFC